jgi:hypothetical protein
MKKRQYNVAIKAPKEKVWDILWGKGTYEEWTAVFAEGSTAETDWQEGSKVLFHDGKGEGMLAKIAKRRDNEYMGLQHLGMVTKGKEITEGPEVDSWKGAEENYTLTGENGSTQLQVDIDITEDMLDYFDKTWPKALDKLKQMAES